MDNLTIYYGSFLAFPYVCWLFCRGWKKKKYFSLENIVGLLGLIFIWSRFIEPQLLFTEQTTIKNISVKADIVLVADLHIGIYKGPKYLERVVNKVNSLPADFNVIAGDFIFAINTDQLVSSLAPLKKLNRPTYFVLGNHDTETERLNEILIGFGLINIEQRLIDLDAYQIAGVPDRWGGRDKPSFNASLQNKPLIMVAHNPDSSIEFDGQKTTIILAGHTHCGQIRIPILYKKVIPSEFGYNCGLESAKTKNGSVPMVITAGVGEIALPIRLLNPPTVDLIHLEP